MRNQFSDASVITKQQSNNGSVTRSARRNASEDYTFTPRIDSKSKAMAESKYKEHLQNMPHHDLLLKDAALK